MSYRSFLYRIYNKYTSRSLVLLSCVISCQYKYINYDNYKSKCDEIVKEALNSTKANENAQTINVTTDNNNNDDSDDDSAWEAEKQSCSFCRQFLQSPCKFPFKNWSKCVDKAKVDNTDFVTECSQYTSALMTCTSDNAEYFNALFAQQKMDDGDDIDDENITDNQNNDDSNNSSSNTNTIMNADTKQ